MWATGTTSFTLVVNEAGVDKVIDRFNPGLLDDNLLKSEAHDIVAAQGANAQGGGAAAVRADGGGGGGKWALTAAQGATLDKLANAL